MILKPTIKLILTQKCCNNNFQESHFDTLNKIEIRLEIGLNVGILYESDYYWKLQKEIWIIFVPAAE